MSSMPNAQCRIVNTERRTPNVQCRSELAAPRDLYTPFPWTFEVGHRTLDPDNYREDFVIQHWELDIEFKISVYHT